MSPNANHTRFEHVLGTYHLVSSLDQRILENAEEAKQYAILHHILETPFSYATTDVTNALWEQEKINKSQFLEELLKMCGFDCKDTSSIAEGILDKYRKPKWNNSNKLNRGFVSSHPFNASRVDSLLRDAFYCGLHRGIYLPHLYKNIKYHADEFCYLEFDRVNYSLLLGLEDMLSFIASAIIYHPARRYKNRIGARILYESFLQKIIDIEYIKEPERFLFFDDNILIEIERQVKKDNNGPMLQLVGLLHSLEPPQPPFHWSYNDCSPEEISQLFKKFSDYKWVYNLETAIEEILDNGCKFFLDFPYYSVNTYESIASIPISVWEKGTTGEKVILFSARPSSDNVEFKGFRMKQDSSKNSNITEVMKRLNLIEPQLYCTKNLDQDELTNVITKLKEGLTSGVNA